MTYRRPVVAFFFVFVLCAVGLEVRGEDKAAPAEVNAPVFKSWPPDANQVFPEPEKPKVETERTERITSTVNAASFRRIGRHLYTKPDATIFDERAALVFINAALSLDPFGEYAMEDFLYLKTSLNERENWPVMRRLLITHLEQKRDIEPARAMVRYLLEDMGTREKREQALADLFNVARDKNSQLASDIAVEYGILTAEKGDISGAASRYLTAYRLYSFNVLAAAKLAEAAEGGLTPLFYASDLRLAITTDPLDLQAVLSFAAYMEKYGSWRAAARAYEYAANLYKYLYPRLELPPQITRPWALSCYNQGGRVDKCIEIAQMAMAGGRIDAVLEGIARKAAEKEGAKGEVQAITARMEELLSSQTSGEDAQTAWYYAFGAKEAGKALSWANKAYAADPNSLTVKSLLIYALVINGQGDVAGEMVKELGDRAESDQIVKLAMGVKLLAEQKKDDAVAALKRAIDIRPDTIEAAEARDLLAYNGESYSGIDEKMTSDITGELKTIYGEDIMPQWMSPDKIVSLKLISRMESDPSFDSVIKIEMNITNNWSSPLMVGHGGLIAGHIRIDGRLEGDVQKDLPELVSRQLGRWSVLQPGESVTIPLDMNVNGIYEALQDYPQARLNLVFTAYLDPVTEGQTVRNTIAGLVPGRVSIERRPAKPTRDLIANRLEVLGKGYEPQKIQSARMFASLLRERAAINAGKIKYNAIKLEPALLKSAVIRALDDDNQTVKVETMAAMAGIELDYDLTSAVAEGLQSKYWPTRLLSIYLLGTSGNSDFSKVLKWYIENDKDDNVRKMAQILMERLETVSRPARAG